MKVPKGLQRQKHKPVFRLGSNKQTDTTTTDAGKMNKAWEIRGKVQEPVPALLCPFKQWLTTENTSCLQGPQPATASLRKAQNSIFPCSSNRDISHCRHWHKVVLFIFLFSHESCDNFWGKLTSFLVHAKVLGGSRNYEWISWKQHWLVFPVRVLNMFTMWHKQISLIISASKNQLLLRNMPAV